MGKGTISSGGTAGLYSVEIQYNQGNKVTREAALTTTILKLAVQLAAVEGELAAKSTEADTLLANITALANEAAALATEQEGLYVQKEQLEGTVAGLEEQVDYYNEQLPAMEAALDNLASQKTDLENQIAASEDPEEIAELQAQLDAVTSSIITLTGSISSLNSALETLDESLTQQSAALSAVESAISNNTSSIESKMGEIESSTATLQQTQLDSARLSAKKNSLQLQKLAAEKAKATLLAIPETKTVSAWCADYTEDLSGDVGTIEVPGESTHINVWPGYDKATAAYSPVRDGQLMKIASMTPAQFFFNFAALPGWQKWKPTFRYATITAINDNTADISLEDIRSSQQEIEINQASTLSNVPIEYMNCHEKAFAVDDIVVVMFNNQKFDDPKIIGFKDNPKQCKKRCIAHVIYESLTTSLQILLDLETGELITLQDPAVVNTELAQPFSGAVILSSVLNKNNLLLNVDKEMTVVDFILKPTAAANYEQITPPSPVEYTYDNSYQEESGMLCNYVTCSDPDDGELHDCRNYYADYTIQAANPSYLYTHKHTLLDLPDFIVYDKQTEWTVNDMSITAGGFSFNFIPGCDPAEELKMPEPPAEWVTYSEHHSVSTSIFRSFKAGYFVSGSTPVYIYGETSVTNKVFTHYIDEVFQEDSYSTVQSISAAYNLTGGAVGSINMPEIDVGEESGSTSFDTHLNGFATELGDMAVGSFESLSKSDHNGDPTEVMISFELGYKKGLDDLGTEEAPISPDYNISFTKIYTYTDFLGFFGLTAATVNAQRLAGVGHGIFLGFRLRGIYG